MEEPNGRDQAFDDEEDAMSFEANVIDMASRGHHLQDIDRDKSEFVAMVAHDLRSPMAAVLGFAETLYLRWDDLEDASKMQIVRALMRSSRNLNRFIDNALQVTSLEAGEFTYDIEPFDLGSVVRSTVEGMGPTEVARFNVSIEAALPPALGDHRRQWQILTNLLANAIKFSPPDASVDVAVRRHGAELEVSVRDHGIGIHEDDVPKLFRRFTRLDQARGSVGTGLGLYMCKQMVEAQGGEITVESRPGAGSRFSYTIPTA